MKTSFYISTVTFLFSFLCLSGQTKETTFTFWEGNASVTWACKDIAPDLPTDWSDYKYLILKLKVSTPQLLFISLIRNNKAYTQGLQLLSGIPIQFSIPLSYFREPPPSASDMASTYKKWYPFGMINLGGSFGDFKHIDSIRFTMNTPVNNPILELYPYISLSNEPNDKILQDGYVVDSFGQWTIGDWPNKVKTQEELLNYYCQEDKVLEKTSYNSFSLSQYGGFKNMRLKPTGFFRTENIEGKWWFVDPDGYLFLSTGACCIQNTNPTRTGDREYIFEDIPEVKEGFTDYYKRNLERRYGYNKDSLWIDKTLKRMKAWGLNTVGNWSNEQLWQQEVPFVLTLDGLNLHEYVMGLADIYDEKYREYVQNAIKNQTGKYKDNPWLLGYFIGNEQPWPGHEELLCNRILSGTDTPMRQALVSYLKEHGDTPEKKRLFIYETFNMFLDFVNTILKTFDPNHLNLGIRFGSEISNELLHIAGKHFDVFSFNCYQIEPNHEFIKRIDKATGLPCLIGEFHFGVPGRGLASGLVSVNNYEERGNAFRYYVENGYSHPSLIGVHWFQWIDEPNTGRMDGENYNIGMVDVTDRPYPLLIEAIQQTSRRIFNIHLGIMNPSKNHPRYAIQ